MNLNFIGKKFMTIHYLLGFLKILKLKKKVMALLKAIKTLIFTNKIQYVIANI